MKKKVSPVTLILACLYSLPLQAAPTSSYQITELLCAATNASGFLWSIHARPEFTTRAEIALNLTLEGGKMVSNTMVDEVGSWKKESWKNSYAVRMKAENTTKIKNLWDLDLSFAFLGSDASLETTTTSATGFANHDSEEELFTKNKTLMNNPISVASGRLHLKLDLSVTPPRYRGDLVLEGVDLGDMTLLPVKAENTSFRGMKCFVRFRPESDR